MRRDFSLKPKFENQHSLFDDFFPHPNLEAFQEFEKTLAKGLARDSWVVIIPSKTRSHLVDSLNVQLGSEYSNSCGAVESNIVNGLFPQGTVFAQRKRNGSGLTFWFVAGNIKKELSKREVAAMCCDWEIRKEFFVKRFIRQKEILRKRKNIERGKK